MKPLFVEKNHSSTGAPAPFVLYIDFSLRSIPLIKYLMTYFFLAACLFATASSAPFGLVNGGLKMDFKVMAKAITHEYSGYNRTSYASIDVPLQNQQFFYQSTLYFGSNKQKIDVIVDTGSSELWVIGVGPDCTLETCSSSGVYNHTSSSTSTNTTNPFQIGYGGGTKSLGYYFEDQISFAGVTINQAEFGVSDETSSTLGILGLGFDTLMGQYKYPNFPDLLVSQGIIDKKYYSIYLNGPDSPSGSVIFGGIDSNKYSGNLAAVPITSTTRLTVNLDSVSYPDGLSISGDFDILLDTGTTLTSLPQNIADSIASKFQNPKYLPDRSCYQIGCQIPQGNVTYNFGNGASVQVPYSAFLWYQQGDTCFLGVSYQMAGLPAILGDNFLRSAYLVFDLTDNTISFAQSVFS